MGLLEKVMLLPPFQQSLTVISKAILVLSVLEANKSALLAQDAGVLTIVRYHMLTVPLMPVPFGLSQCLASK